MEHVPTYKCVHKFLKQQMKIRSVVVKVLDVGREVTAKAPERVFNSDGTVLYIDCGSSTTTQVKVSKLRI